MVASLRSNMVPLLDGSAPAGRSSIPAYDVPASFGEAAAALSDGDDAKADVRRRRRRRVGAARAHAVAVAVRVVAEKRPAAQRAPSALARVGAPLPDVAADVEEAEAVRFAGIGRDRLRSPAARWPV